MRAALGDSVDNTVEIFVPDSSSTTGAGLTGLVYNSAGLTASYNRTRSARVAISLITRTVAQAHSDGGFVEIDAVNMPGLYRLDVPDACFVSGVANVTVQLSGAADMAPVNREIAVDLPVVADSTAIAAAVWSVEEGKFLYRQGRQKFVRGNWDYAQIVGDADWATETGFSIHLYSSDDIAADDWNNDFGTMAADGTFSDAGDQGDPGNGRTFFAISAALSGGVVESDKYVLFQVSDDGANWITLFRWNVKGWGTNGLGSAYVQNDGGLSYPRLSSESSTNALSVRGELGTDARNWISTDTQPDINLQPAIGDDNISRQADTSNITVTGSASNKPVIGDNASAPLLGVSSVGTPTNTYTSTIALDGVTQSIAPVGSEIDWIWQSNIGPTGVPSSVQFTGYVAGNADDLIVEGYDPGTTSWIQIGTWNGQGGTSILPHLYDLYSSMVDADGDVWVRLRNTGGTGLFALHVDQILVSHSIEQSTVGYANGAVWVDTLDGTAGSVTDINGVADKPCLLWSDALTVAAAKGLKKFEIGNGSSITLTGDSSGFKLLGDGWGLDLNGQIISGIFINGSRIEGVGVGGAARPAIERSRIDNVTLPECALLTVGLGGTLTLEAGDYYLEQCYSIVAGLLTPTLDFNSAGDTNVSFRHYSGGIELQNMGVGGTDKMSLEGDGQYIINVNCTGGELAVRGSFKKTDNTAGVITIDDDANSYSPVLRTGKIQAATINTVTLDAAASSVDGRYDPSIIEIVGGDTRAIIEYDGTTKIAILDRNFKTIPTGDVDDFKIIADAGREHVNEGLARGGTSNTIQLNGLASGEDGAYNGQVIFVRSGLNSVDDQRRIVIAYVGATQTATVDRDWDVIPITANKPGYSMLPYVGVDTLEFRAAVQAMMRNDVSAPSWLGGTFVPSSHSNQAIRIQGDAAWLSGSSAIIISGISGQTLNSLTNTGQSVQVYRGDDGVNIPYDLNTSIVGYTVEFAAKADVLETGTSSFAIGPKDITSDVISDTDGTGVIPLDGTDLDLDAGTYVAELRITKTGEEATMLQFDLVVVRDVMTE